MTVQYAFDVSTKWNIASRKIVALYAWMTHRSATALTCALIIGYAALLSQTSRDRLCAEDKYVRHKERPISTINVKNLRV